jgi:hypothetical protein
MRVRVRGGGGVGVGVGVAVGVGREGVCEEESAGVRVGSAEVFGSERGGEE